MDEVGPAYFGGTWVHTKPHCSGPGPLRRQRQPPSLAIVGDVDPEEPTDAQGPAQRPGSLGEQVPRGSLMVRVGGGWVALDEYLVKNDPGRAKGRTSQKIHERFLSWAVVPSRPAPKVTSPILRAPSCLLPRKTGLGACWGHRDPSSSRSRPRKGTRKGTAQDSLARPTQD
ncbi:microtubule-actin cross-linking factor 1-like isoform X2 [Phyllostomus discolor]|uniref:Microtubule-actin cross-linking factor 1-like isoform X2 n=1 Tax=Phyllostomus discolor TaxID=89673 RepID=A0A7E6E818_9CHIR|nr:microtubule-actin cross-linking factor 1-like isoform X2 [Phyllostomus discolor]